MNDNSSGNGLKEMGHAGPAAPLLEPDPCTQASIPFFKASNTTALMRSNCFVFKAFSPFPNFLHFLQFEKEMRKRN